MKAITSIAQGFRANLQRRSGPGLILEEASALLSGGGDEASAAAIVLGFLAKAWGPGHLKSIQLQVVSILSHLAAESRSDSLDDWCDEHARDLDAYTSGFLGSRELAVLALGHMGAPEGITILAHILDSWGDAPSTRMLAAEALGDIHHPDVIQALVRALDAEDDGEFQIRPTALDSLSRLPPRLRRQAAPLVSEYSDRLRQGKVHDVPDESWSPEISNWLASDKPSDNPRA